MSSVRLTFWFVQFLDVARALAKIDIVRNNPKPSPCPSPPSYNRSVSRFIRRIVGIPVELQTRLFQYFSDTLSIIISQAMVSPDLNESGITDIGSDHEVRCTNLYTFSTQFSVGPEKVELYRFEIDRGVIWSKASEQWSFLTGSNSGFYTSKMVNYFQVIFNNFCILFYRDFPCKAKSANVSLVVEKDILSTREDKVDQYLVICPNSGLQLLPVSLDDVKQLQKISPDEAKPIWNHCYQSAKNDCFHIQLSVMNFRNITFNRKLTSLPFPGLVTALEIMTIGLIVIMVCDAGNVPFCVVLYFPFGEKLNQC